MKIEKNKTILIIANGDPPRDVLLKKLVEKSDVIIASDGGSNICYQNNIYPHFIIGDLDSIETRLFSIFKDAEVIQLIDQETHDLNKAIGFAKTLKPRLILITAAFGKRLDHSLANLLLLQNEFKNVPLEFYDDYGQLSIITNNRQLKLSVGQTVSLFGLLPVYGLSLSGFRYPLKSRNFPSGFNGLSNVITSADAQISIKKGFLYLYITNEYTAP
jgi:thiamine pyrophosphokinase